MRTNNQFDMTNGLIYSYLVRPPWPLVGLASVIVWCTILCTVAGAADPRIEVLIPQGAQRGSEATITINGARIGLAPQEIQFVRPGIAVRNLEAINGKQVKAELTIADDCPLGIHPIRVRTESGLSNLMTLHIGALAEVAEQEPNSDFQSPQQIALDVVVNGVVQNEDVDYYSVELAEGERLSVEVEGLRLGRTFFDPAIAVFNAERFELASCDDATLVYQDAYVSMTAPKAGRYVIAVRETAYRGNGACTYRLHVGRFPRPAAVFPPGGRPGETIEVRWIGDAGGEWNETVTLPEKETPEHPLLATSESGIAPSGIPVRVTDLPAALEIEPNNNRSEATPAAAPSACMGVIEVAGDHDYFRFSAKKGQALDVHAYARQLRSPLDPVMRIYDAQGKRLAGNDDNAGKPDSYFQFRAPADGEYVLQVEDHLGSGGPEFVYRVEIAPPRRWVDLMVEEERRYFATVADVPRGGRTALLVRATRRNIGGPLELITDGLPEGVTATALPLPGNFNRIPVILSATEDAALSGARVRLSARKTDTDQQDIENRFAQQTWLVRGQNNRPMWNYFDDRLPVAVTSKLPFRLRLEPLKSPIVQSGSKEVKVIAERDEGFDERIAVHLLYNPPGVSSNRSRGIEKGQLETTIPVTAAGNARVGDWPITVLGTANVRGRVVAATELITMQVAKPYVAFQFPTVATEQGKPVEFTIGVTHATPLEGSAEVKLLGLPPGVTAPPAEITAESKQLTFPLEVAADARVGTHGRVFCQVHIVDQGEPVLHTIGYGKLQIDPPPEPEPEPKPETTDTVAQK